MVKMELSCRRELDLDLSVIHFLPFLQNATISFRAFRVGESLILMICSWKQKKWQCLRDVDFWRMSQLILRFWSKISSKIWTHLGLAGIHFGPILAAGWLAGWLGAIRELPRTHFLCILEASGIRDVHFTIVKCKNPKMDNFFSRIFADFEHGQNRALV